MQNGKVPIQNKKVFRKTSGYAKLKKLKKVNPPKEIPKNNFSLTSPNIMKIGDFLSENIKNDELNRVVDEEWVNNIVSSQIEYYQKYKEFYYPDSFLVCYHDGDVKLLDGQHRRKSLEIISKIEEYEHIKNSEISVRVVAVENYDQKAAIFNLANTKLVGNSSCYMFKTDDDNALPTENKIKDEIIFKCKCEIVRKLLIEKYTNKIFAPKLNTNNLVPRICLDDFINALRSLPKIKEMTGEEIFETLVKENDLCKDFMNNSNHSDMINRCNKILSNTPDFYLGYYHFYREAKCGIRRTSYSGCKWLSLIFF